MLELAIVRRNSLSGSLNLAQLLDVMLFYGSVHLILDAPAFLSLLQQIGARKLGRLLDSENVHASITPQMLGVLSRGQGQEQVHRPGFFTVGGQEGHQTSLEVFLDRAKNLPGITVPSRGLMDRLLRKGRRTTFEKLLDGEQYANELFASLATDEVTLRLAIRQVGESKGVDIPDAAIRAMSIRANVVEDTVAIQSMPDIRSLIPPENETDNVWGAVLARLQDYSIDLLLSQIRSGDLVVSPEVGDMATSRIDLTLKRGLKSQEALADFTEFTLQNGSSLGLAYEQGAVSFDAALDIIAKARRFRKWLSDIPPDADLLANYHAEVTKGTILDTVVGKSARFSFIGGAGIVAGLVGSAEVGLAASLGLGVFDTFVLDGLVRGWRPNAFVGALKRRIAPR